MSARGDAQSTCGQGSAYTQARRRQFVDELMDDYVSWRETCAGVAAAYENWRCAKRQDQKLAFGGYVASLDREEQAARAYQAAVARLAAA
jgi:hypothetical protein